MKALARLLIGTLLLAQLVAAVRVIARLVCTASGDRIARKPFVPAMSRSVAVIVPVLDEEVRIGACMQGLIRQGQEVREIIVVDGGSRDRTADVAGRFAARDGRVRIVDASPIPDGWNGKPWGLHVGTQHVSEGVRWILTIDADVRPGEELASSLVAHATSHDLRVLSVATPQRVSGAAEAPIHTSLLTSLVYRYGIPGHAYRDPADVQANGQCFLIDRDVLARAGGFEAVKRSIVEDVTLARRCAVMGEPVGFYEMDSSAALVTVEMYAGWYDALQNWSRSLPMRDRDSGLSWWSRMVEMTLAMGAPLPLLATALLWRGMPLRALVSRLNMGLLAMRLGTQAGETRAYSELSQAHWLAVLIDPVSVVMIWRQALRRTHRWRGRVVRG
jgi:dolichol-phosphate mannosyltransferase